MIKDHNKFLNPRFFSLQPDLNKLPDREMIFEPNDFEAASEEKKEHFIEKAESVSYWADAWRRLKGNKVAMISLGIIIIIFLFSFIGPLFTSVDYSTQARHADSINLSPSFEHPFGTDKFGRELFVRAM